MKYQDVFLGLGSNLDKPLQQLQQAVSAIAALPDCQLIKVSSAWRSKPMGPQQQPDFVNAVVEISTGLEPMALLKNTQHIENQQGRVRKQRWGARTLDIDILLFADQCIRFTQLEVPHYDLANRDFVLRPLLEIAPHSCLPNGQKLATLLQQCPDHGLMRLDVELIATST